MRETGIGTLFEERATDLNEESCRKRYRVFMEQTYSVLQSLKELFHFHVINAQADIASVERAIISEFKYQSSLELDDETFDAIHRIPLASEIVIAARQHLVERLESYQRSSADLFHRVIMAIDREFVPALVLHAMTGLAKLTSDDELYANPLAVSMLVDVLNERGYRTCATVETREVPSHVDPVTHAITCTRQAAVQVRDPVRGFAHPPRELTQVVSRGGEPIVRGYGWEVDRLALGDHHGAADRRLSARPCLADAFASAQGVSPVKPPKSVRRREALRQALRLPKTLLAIRRIIAEDYQIPALDEHLWSFRGFHDDVEDPHYRARQWQKVRMGAIAPRDVAGLAVWEMAFMLNVARELEEPILEYSHQNGEGFRVLLPSLARFLGKNQDEVAYAARHNLPWCESPWCAEERRHASTFARIIERLTNTSPGRDNPNSPKVVTASEADAVKLVISRQAAEWNSSSTYLVLAAHATGDLHHLLRNVARDEIKHLAILGAVDRYLFGPRRWRRFGDLLRHGIDQFNAQKHRRSGGDLMGTNPVTALEVIAAHMISEYYIRRWLATLPLVSLVSIFEVPSSLAELAATDLSPEQRAASDATVRTGEQKRVSLARWEPGEQRRALDQRAFEANQAGAIDEIVAAEFGGFRGAEAPGSRHDRADAEEDPHGRRTHAPRRAFAIVSATTRSGTTATSSHIDDDGTVFRHEGFCLRHRRHCWHDDRDSARPAWPQAMAPKLHSQR